MGNIDRNNGNWGILKNEITKEKRLAPIFDNGNCFNNLISDNQIKDVIDNNKFDIYLNNQHSFFVDDNEKPINMYDLMSSGKEIKLSEAIKKMFPKLA